MDRIRPGLKLKRTSGTDAKVDLRISELRFRMGDREVAGGHQAAASADRGTMDPSDDRDLEVSYRDHDPCQAVQHATHRGGFAPGGLQVHAVGLDLVDRRDDGPSGVALGSGSFRGGPNTC